MVNNRSNNKRRKNRFSNEKYSAPYSQEMLSMSIDGLGFSDSTLATLKAGKIATVNDIVTRRASEMYRIQNFGKKNLLEVSAKLRALGADFRADDKVAAAGAEAPPRHAQTAEKGAVEKVPAQRDNGRKQVNTQQVNTQKVTNNNSHNNNKPNDGQQNVKKGKKEDNSYSSARLFPREPFVPTAPVPPHKDKYIKMQRAGKWGFRDAAGKEVIPPIYDEVFSFKEDIACVEKNGLFGYINRKNELIIPYKYECASSFSEGLACVVVNEKCGYIDDKGEVVLPMEFEAGTPFSEGVARVKKDGKWGLLKKDGGFITI